MSKNRTMKTISLFVGVFLCMALMQTAFANGTERIGTQLQKMSIDDILVTSRERS